MPCGHASMCYACALQTAISLSGLCPLCRTRTVAIVTYEFAREDMADEPEAVATQRDMEEKLRKTERGEEERRGDVGNGNAAADSNKAEQDIGNDKEQSSTTPTANCVTNGDQYAEMTPDSLVWIAKVNGPSGELLDYLSSDDLERIIRH